jgi:hypothetical protein
MSTDFPYGPVPGQIYTNGLKTWKYTGTFWQNSTANNIPSATASDSAPVNPGINSLWWNTTLGQLFIYYNNGYANQWVPVTPAIAGPQGVTGYTGSYGYVGSQGIGYTGSIGAASAIGYTGSVGIGYTGSSAAGYTGSSGSTPSTAKTIVFTSFFGG